MSPFQIHLLVVGDLRYILSLKWVLLKLITKTFRGDTFRMSSIVCTLIYANPCACSYTYYCLCPGVKCSVR